MPSGCRAAGLDEAEARLLFLGATCPELQPDPDRFLVPTDPAGHFFCLVRFCLVRPTLRTTD
ncbi:VOC family protein [Streptomyces sp. DG2A-72]|nr:VOC family protein [Streptomyces sp. DG2A-72]MDO0935564.1 VOC family protein [Streptomyces sp. DG2A-72]